MLHEEIEIEASPEAVWAALGDVRNLARWSPQVDSTRLADGAETCGRGTRFTNRNVDGDLAWVTHAEITAYDEGSRLAFRVEENHVTWLFAIEGVDERTRVVHRREEPEGISDLALEMVEAFLGGEEAFTRKLQDGMRRTLVALKAEVEETS